MNAALKFALICATKLIDAADMVRLAPALAECAADCAEAWGQPRPSVLAMDLEAEIPDDYIPVVYTGSDGDPNMLAVHWFDDVRNRPACRVYQDAGSGLNTGRNSSSEGGSHEVNETLVDPMADKWVPHPTRPGVEVAFEICDPSQRAYTKEAHGIEWQIANFVYPAWFDARYADPAEREAYLAAGGKFDHMGELSGPGEVGDEGYLILRARDENGRLQVWYEMKKTGMQQLSASELKAMLPPHKAAAFEHKLSRSRRRGESSEGEAA